MDTPLTTGVPWLDKTIVGLSALGALASLLAHFVPPYTKVGKVISWLALNFGKGLVKPDPTPIIVDKPKGFVSLWVLLVVSLLSLGAFAQAPPAPPQFGGCIQSGKLCVGPSIALSLAAFNLQTGKMEAAFAPGIGYGFTYNPGTWKSLGADFYVTVDPGAQKASVSFLGKLLNGYFRPGFSKAFVSDHAWRFLFSTGIDLP